MKGIKSRVGRKLLHLKNEQGRGLTITLREYRAGDEEGMIACVRDEYGDTYFKRGFYEPAYIKQESDDGHILFMVAQTKAGEIAGMLILKNFRPKEDMCEIASQIFRKKYRGYGLAMPFFEYAMEILLKDNYSAALCLPVLFHDVTQRLLYRLGLRATGFIMNVFDMKNITHSYHNGKNMKHSQGIQIRAVNKQDAGTVYIPDEHKNFVAKIYDNLGVKYCISKEYIGSINELLHGNNNGLSRLPQGNSGSLRGLQHGNSDSLKGLKHGNGNSLSELPQGNSGSLNELPQGNSNNLNVLPPISLIHFWQNELQKSLEINVHMAGEDLADRIEELHKKYPLKGAQIANIFLNCSKKSAVWAYYVLKDLGYFFTGLKPLCGKDEYMVLHNPGEVEIYFEDYVVSSEFAKLLNYVRKAYEDRRRPT